MSFKSVQAKIAKTQQISGPAAGAILAAASRRASPAAKKRNPKLKRVKWDARMDLDPRAGIESQSCFV